VLAFRLGLIAQPQGKTVGLAGQAVKSLPQYVVAVLGAGDFDIRSECTVSVTTIFY